VLAGKNDAPVWTPPRIVQRPDNFDDCHSETAGDLARSAERSVNLTIAADGTLKDFTLPEGSPDWMKDLSACAMKRFRFSPATRNGKPAETPVSLTIKFRARGPNPPADMVIEGVGALITAPRLGARPEGLNLCFPDRQAVPGMLNRLVVTVTILPDGSWRDLTFPPGSESWQEEVARCMLGRITFLPGTLDGVPVEAQATLPLVVTTGSGNVVNPKLRSTAEELEAAYRACYPLDLLTITSATYRFDVATNGHVSNPKVVKGSGDPLLDEAGACILKMLEFSPLKQNNRAMKSSVTWELPIRPPR
jgi:hypothetical protein